MTRREKIFLWLATYGGMMACIIMAATLMYACDSSRAGMPYSQVRRYMMIAGSGPSGGAPPAIDPNLKAWWEFTTDNGTNYYDSTTNGVNLFSTAPAIPSYVSGTLRFDGSNTVVWQNPTSVVFNIYGTQITVSAWTKLLAVTPANKGNILVSKDPFAPTVPFADPWQLFYLAIDGSSKIFWNLSSGVAGSRKTLTSTATVGTGVWTMVTGTYDGTTMRVYKNGIVDATTTAASLTIGTNAVSYAFTLGRWLHSGDTSYNAWLNGYLDDVQIYDRRLSSNEVFLLWQSTTNQTPARP